METINNAYEQYPWASEATMEKLAGASIKNTATTVALSNVIAKAAGKDYQDKLQDIVRRNQKAKKTASEKGNDFYSSLKDSFSKSLNANNPFDVYENFNDSSLKDAADELADILPNNKAGIIMGKAVKIASKAAGGAGLLLAGLAAVVKMASQHQKELNDGMDLGMLDLGDMTNLKRVSYAAIGSFDEMMKIQRQSLPAFTNMAGDSLTGARQFAYFAAQAEQINIQNGKGDFGLGIQEFATALAGEAELLYQLNEVEALDAQGKKRITNSFAKVMGITTYMAGAFGEQRDAMLQEREANLTDVDFIDAYTRSTEVHLEKFGKAAMENSREGYNTLVTMLNALNMPPEFVENVKSTMNRARADLQFDAEVTNNATPEFLELLTLSGFGPEFLELMNTVLIGKDLSPPQVVNELSAIFRDAHDNGIMLMGTDEASVRQRELLVSITNITDARFAEMSKASEAYIETVGTGIEETDDFVDAADSFKKMKGQFASLTTVTYEVTSAIGSVVSWFLNLFNRENRYANMTTDQVISTMYGDGDTEEGEQVREEIEQIYERTSNIMVVTDNDGQEYELRVFYAGGQISGVQNLTDPEYAGNNVALLRQQVQKQVSYYETIASDFSQTEQAQTPEGQAQLVDMAQEAARARTVLQELTNFSNFGRHQAEVRMNDVGIVMVELKNDNDARYAEIKQAYDELVAAQDLRPQALDNVYFNRDQSQEDRNAAAQRLAEVNQQLTREYNEFVELLYSLGIDQELEAINGR